MKQEIYLHALDQALVFVARHTDQDGRMVVDGEIDTKDSGWFILGAVIRATLAGWSLDGLDLKDLTRRWTLATVRVDDTKSAWSTFALLYSQFLAPREFPALFSDSERAELKRFFRQIDMRFLLEASRNYHVAAAFIDTLRLRFGYISQLTVNPNDCIQYMLDGYLGNGFFNDDDGRGDRNDRRIDAYSAEILGLLLHYDEIHEWSSPFHNRIFQLLQEACDNDIYLIDQDGEFAKWGRSLRGEAEVKKIFLWEVAQTHHLTQYGETAAQALFAFFQKTGLRQDGKIGRDKAFDQGIWDEYTTHVQAQGYGVYGLALAAKFATGEHVAPPLPAALEDYVRTLPGPQITVSNSATTGLHYIIPEANRLTKNMFFWHNRITGENDVEVDVSSKFMPMPYIGHKCPAPYSGAVLPFLPMLRLSNGKLLVPRNLSPMEFRFCNEAEYTPVCDTVMRLRWLPGPAKLGCQAQFTGGFPEGCNIVIHFFDTDASLRASIHCLAQKLVPFEAGPSIYGPRTTGKLALLEPTDSLSYEVNYAKT
ncbi:MAG: hypothetical protein IJJ26_06140 [Victivallales bacterium]|nr:hypothetical protein [Victivallales bacterium]